MPQKIAHLGKLVSGAAVVAALAFGASVAQARPAAGDCFDPPTLVGSCETPGFNCQAECEIYNDDPVTGVCLGSGCCACILGE